MSGSMSFGARPVASRFRTRTGAPSGFGVSPAGSSGVMSGSVMGSGIVSPLAGFMPASGGFTGDGVIAPGMVEPEALEGTAVDRLSALAGLSGPAQYTPPPPAPPPPAPAAPVQPEMPWWPVAEGSNVGDASGDAGGDAGGDGGGGDGGDGGYMAGGYTGPGHPAEPAGTVHRGEVVIPAEMVARYGLRPLMALVEGQVPPSRLAALARG